MLIQRIDDQTTRISRVASGKFLRPNNSGVKLRLANRLMAKGIEVVDGNFRRAVCRKTYPNEIRIIGYSICQIRLIVDGSGVQSGLESVLYQSSQVISVDFC